MTIEQKVQAKIRGNINLTPAKWKLINDTIGFTLKEVGEILEKCDQENCWNLREVIEKLGIKQTKTKEVGK